MMEVYNESVYNLLVSSSTDVHEKLTIQQKGKEIIVVVRLNSVLCITDSLARVTVWIVLKGLTEFEVTCMEDVFKMISVGEKNRTTASTKMNTNRFDDIV